jgi:hypothetical protein
LVFGCRFWHFFPLAKKIFGFFMLFRYRLCPNAGVTGKGGTLLGGKSRCLRY